MKDTFYITTPIYYPNGNPHMGHAYTTILADILARYKRMLGFDVYFLTGTDENSEKIEEPAKKAGKKREVFVDEMVMQFKQLYSDIDISYNQFIRTTDKEKHWAGAIELWKRLEKKGDIYKADYEGLYCVGCEAFITEKELIDGKCPYHDKEPQKIKEENYFFTLSKYTDAIREAVGNNTFAIEPDSRRKETLALLEEGLKDVSFSRPKTKIPWGIPVPEDDTQVMYVWCDALSNYISALGFGRDDEHNFSHYWPADVQLLGKDILKFHALIWPGMLLSAGIELPKKLFVHGFITSQGKKMSKTLGNVINPQDIVSEYGGEVLRYYLARHINPSEDSDMTIDSFKDAYNAHLANGIGNLSSRILKMVEQYSIDLEELMLKSKEEILGREDAREYHDAFEKVELHTAIDFVWTLISFMDSFIQEEQPFKTIKTDEEKAHRDILFMVEKLWEVSVFLEPFMPETTEKIQEAIKKGKSPETLFPRK